MPTLKHLLPVCVLTASIAVAQNAQDGRRDFESRCSGCHGTDANGGPVGPSILRPLGTLSDEQIVTTVNNGLPTRGMPAFHLTDQESRDIVTFLRTLVPATPARGGGGARARRGGGGRGGFQPVRGSITTQDGTTVDGMILGRGTTDLAMRTSDNKIHLYRKVAGSDRYRAVTSEVDWPSYNGSYSSNRYSPRTDINRESVKHLGARWVFNMPNQRGLEVTPVVVDGIMYVTGPNECYALDAGTGRELWHYQRPRTEGLIGNAAGGINRGVAIAGDLAYMVTDNAHLLAFQRFNGELMWETEMADWHQNYNATLAPLAVKNMVISGTSGGEEGVRGFVAAFDQKTGKELWRFWTVPAPGEPGSETWVGKDLAHGGSVTWMTGSYDPELDTLYWQTGNPGNDFNGDHRGGDNLYSDCVLALDPNTGKLKWHYQFTPHDVWDWDAEEPMVLVDADWHGSPRKLLLQANRNGFFYVLDRATGELLLGKPFVEKLTWAKEIGKDGRPVMNPNQIGTEEGVKVCPAVSGAANWFSTAYDPATGYYYVNVSESCAIYRKTDSGDWEAGRRYAGGGGRGDPEDPSKKILRAIDIQTGKIAWEIPQGGSGGGSGGVLATAGGVVIFCEDSGALMAADSKTGELLWSFHGGQGWRASPMTYVFDGKQYVAIASGANIVALAVD